MENDSVDVQIRNSHRSDSKHDDLLKMSEAELRGVFYDRNVSVERRLKAYYELERRRVVG